MNTENKRKCEVVSWSAGRSSTRLVRLKQLQAQSGEIDVEFVFMDTGAEDQGTYDFIKKAVSEWGIDATFLRVVINPELGKANYYKKITVDEIGDDLQPFADSVKKYGLPYIGGAYCTRAMKGMARADGRTEGPFYAYCNEKYGKGNFTAILGIRADEPNRLNKKPNIGYLADICDYDKEDINDWWSRQSFDLEIPDYLGNCRFCIKKSIPKLSMAIKDRPEEAKKFLKMIESEDVRIKSEKHAKRIMYRGNHTFRSLMEIAESSSREDLLARIKISDKSDKGSCSDSCEPLSFSDNDIPSDMGEVEDIAFNNMIKNLNTPRKEIGERNKNDWYPTSYAMAQKMMERITFKAYDELLDPCKGQRGNEPFYYAFPKHFKKSWAEIDEGVDYFKNEFKADVIITNPPYNIAEDFIKKGMDDLKDGGMMILLLRINYLGSQRRHKSLWTNEKYIPKAIITLAERPSFTGDGKTDMTEYAFYVFGDTSRLKDQSPFQWLSWR